MLNITLISSSGGHYAQLCFVKNYLSEKANVNVITERTSFLKKEIKTSFVYQLKLTSLLFPLKYFINKMIIKKNLKSSKPDYVISFGALCTVPVLKFCKRKKIKTIYIESFSNQDSLTRTGKYFYGKADIFIVQSEELKHKYSESIYIGEMY